LSLNWFHPFRVVLLCLGNPLNSRQFSLLLSIIDSSFRRLSTVFDDIHQPSVPSPGTGCFPHLISVSGFFYLCAALGQAQSISLLRYPESSRPEPFAPQNLGSPLPLTRIPASSSQVPTPRANAVYSAFRRCFLLSGPFPANASPSPV